MRNGIFSAISANKDVTVNINSSPPGHSRRRRPAWSGSHQTAATPYRSLEEPRMWQHRILAPDSWDACEGADFSEPKPSHLPIHRKMLNSLTWDVCFQLTIISWCSGYLPFVSKLLNDLAPSLSSSGQFSQDSLRCCLLGLSPTNFCQIKGHSQLLGCDCFLNVQGSGSGVPASVLDSHMRVMVLLCGERHAR